MFQHGSFFYFFGFITPKDVSVSTFSSCSISSSSVVFKADIFVRVPRGSKLSSKNFCQLFSFVFCCDSAFKLLILDKEITNDDPHSGWKLGSFYVSGYTDERDIDEFLEQYDLSVVMISKM